MTNQEAIDTIKANYPPEHYSMLREALDMALQQLKEQEAVEPICKIIFDIPYYFCGQCNEMLNMYSTKAMFCSKCGRPVKWSIVKE